MSSFVGSRQYTPKDRPPRIVRKPEVIGLSAPEVRCAVSLDNYIPAGFVVRSYRFRQGIERREGILLGQPFHLPQSGTAYYCRILTPTGLFESLIHSLSYLSVFRQTPELKSLLRTARDQVIEEGEEKMFRKLQLFRLSPQEAQHTIRQVLRDLNSNIVNEALQ